ncbi:hypothetical protein DMA11_09150 [Marinilabiliaceae bacterium JC017]|nr:hypothetical protein DMA11_09150 [Marinilabiliaceae bacterium JC017]
MGMLKPFCHIFVVFIVLGVADYSYARMIFDAPPEEEKASQYHQFVKVKSILISGNKITKPRVILNELSFKKDQNVLVNRLEETMARSRQNLLNTSLFNFVSITCNLLPDNEIIFHVRVEERWYWWAFPIVEHADRNFSSFLNNGDWSKVNYGIYMKMDNFRGRREVLKFQLRVGYLTQLKLYYNSPEYKKKTGWGGGIDFIAFDQVPYVTLDNQPVYLRFSDGMAQYVFNAVLFGHYRPELYKRHHVTFSYNQYQVNDSVIAMNPDYLLKGETALKYFEIKYMFSHDTRDSKVYPLNGFYGALTLTKTGFGILNDDLDGYAAEAQFLKYVPVGERWHFGSDNRGKVSNRSYSPYVVKSGIGYGSFLNAYEYYVIDGPMYAFSQNKILFTLMEPRVKKLNFIPLSQFSKIHYAFYLSGFFDLGYVWNEKHHPSNFMVNDLLYGFGLGLDFVTFYDKVVSFNYSMNKFGEHGFFAHINLTF